MAIEPPIAARWSATIESEHGALYLGGEGEEEEERESDHCDRKGYWIFKNLKISNYKNLKNQF